MKHTPGPWKVNWYYWYHYPVYSLNKDVKGVQEIHNNARLMSAAPELLEACKAARSAYYNDMEYNEAMAIVERAIARAEGKPIFSEEKSE